MGIGDSLGAEVGWSLIFWGQPGGPREWQIMFGQSSWTKGAGKGLRKKENDDNPCPVSPWLCKTLRLSLPEQTGEIKNSYLFLLMTR